MWTPYLHAIPRTAAALLNSPVLGRGCQIFSVSYGGTLSGLMGRDALWILILESPQCPTFQPTPFCPGLNWSWDPQLGAGPAEGGQRRGEEGWNAHLRLEASSRLAGLTSRAPPAGEVKADILGPNFQFSFIGIFFFNKSLPGGSECRQREICQDDGLPEIKCILSAVCPSACPSVNNL